MGQCGPASLAAWDNLLLGPAAWRTAARRWRRQRRARCRCCARLLDEDDGRAVTRGTTEDNAANLPTRFIRDIRRNYGKSLLGRQELDGELIEDLPGALWTPRPDRGMHARMRLAPCLSGRVVGRRSAGARRGGRRLRDRGRAAPGRGRRWRACSPTARVRESQPRTLGPRRRHMPPGYGRPTASSPRPTRAGPWWPACCAPPNRRCRSAGPRQQGQGSAGRAGRRARMRRAGCATPGCSRRWKTSCAADPAAGRYEGAGALAGPRRCAGLGADAS